MVGRARATSRWFTDASRPLSRWTPLLPMRPILTLLLLRSPIAHGRARCSLAPLLALPFRWLSRFTFLRHPYVRLTLAVFLLDQAEAFEYLSHAWLRSIRAPWELPRWATAFLLAMGRGLSFHWQPRPIRRRACCCAAALEWAGPLASSRGASGLIRSSGLPGVLPAALPSSTSITLLGYREGPGILSCCTLPCWLPFTLLALWSRTIAVWNSAAPVAQPRRPSCTVSRPAARSTLAAAS